MDGTESEGKIGEANLRLPEHQREALALRELEGLSYDEIATTMETNRGSVAQLISRARINLHDELHGNVLASVAAPSAECERALPLIAMRDDGQLDEASSDAIWLDAHLADCGRCRLGVEVMQEAGASYRAWVPIATKPAESRSGMSPARLASAASRKSAASPGTGRRGGPRRLVPLAAGLALLLLAGVAAAVIAGSDPPTTPVDAAAGTASERNAAALEPTAEPTKGGKAKGGAAKKRKTQTATVEGTGGETASSPIAIPVQVAPEGDPSDEPASGPSRPQGKTAVEPTQRTSAPKPRSEPEPAPTPLPTSPSTSTSVPTVEEPPPSEDSPGKSKGHEPPGKPANRPSK